MKNKSSVLAAFFGILACVGLLTAAFNPYKHTRLNDVRYDNIRAGGQLSFGDSALTSGITLPSSSGALYQMQVPVYNPTASSIPVGTALIASNTGAGYINIAPATIDLTNIIGVAAETISATTKGMMVPHGGGYALVLTTGTISVGDVLVTSGTTAGRFGQDSTPTTGADTAIALTAGVAAGSTILAIMK